MNQNEMQKRMQRIHERLMKIAELTEGMAKAQSANQESDMFVDLMAQHERLVAEDAELIEKLAAIWGFPRPT